MIYIGSHISSSKGYAAMGRQALKLGADTFGERRKCEGNQTGRCG